MQRKDVDLFFQTKAALNQRGAVVSVTRRDVNCSLCAAGGYRIRLKQNNVLLTAPQNQAEGYRESKDVLLAKIFNAPSHRFAVPQKAANGL